MAAPIFASLLWRTTIECASPAAAGSLPASPRPPQVRDEGDHVLDDLESMAPRLSEFAAHSGQRGPLESGPHVEDLLLAALQRRFPS